MAQDYLTWDMMNKSGTLLPPFDNFTKKALNKDFFKRNESIYTQPFLVFYRKSQN